MIPRRDGQLAAAIAHHAAGRLDDAERIYQQLYAVNRDDDEVAYLLGLLCCDLGLFEAACTFLVEALRISPAFSEARAQLARARTGLADLRMSSGHNADAQRLLQHAFEATPADGACLKGLGRLALARDDAAAAAAWLEKALAEAANDAETLNWLGLARLQLGEHAAAEGALRQALRLMPNLVQARNNLGLALHHQGRLGEAQACFERTLIDDPLYRNARINLANTLRILGRHSLAQHELETVLAVRPDAADAADALNNLGAVLQDQGQAESAHRCLTRAMELSPACPEIRWNLALTQLQFGDFQNGWSNFESRWEGCDHLRGSYAMPIERAWRGESVDGKRLLLWAEQGFGDTLQFIRFAQDLARQGAIITVMAPPAVLSLVRTAPGVSSVLPQDQPPPPYDFHSPLMSLPYRLRIPLDAARLHGAEPYLSAAQDRTEHWRHLLSAAPGIKVGLVWAGNSRLSSAQLAAVDSRRSMSLRQLEPILAVPGCRFFSLQKGPAAAELHMGVATVGTIQDFSDHWKDFSDTAAFVANLDLVISVDTAVAHLAGALGKPVWLLNRFDTCWRWLLARNDSPWYGTLRQFRQTRPGDWESPIAAAAVALAQTAAVPQRGIPKAPG